MQARNLVYAVALVGLGCSPATEPEITIDVSPVFVGDRLVDEAAPPFEFDLQLGNDGEKNLVIESAELRHDQNCAFDMVGPDITELVPGDAAFIQASYLPTVVAEDQIILVITSNAENFPEFIVPICGRGVATLDDTLPPLACEVPPDSQPDC